MNQLKARKGISHIYFGLKNNKCLSANIRFNKFFTYNKILEDNKNYISKKEYKKLKNMLNKELNSIFETKRNLKSNYYKKSKK